MRPTILALVNEKYLHMLRALCSSADVVVSPSLREFLPGLPPGVVRSLAEVLEPADLAAVERLVLERSAEMGVRAALGVEGALARNVGKPVRIYEDLALRFPDICRQVLAATAAVNRLSDQGRLRLLLVDNDVRPLQRAAIEVARARGVPSLCLSHGLPSLANLHDEVHADLMAVFGDRCRRWYAAAGVPSHKVAVTGAVILDPHYALRRCGTREEARSQLGLPPDRPVVTLATTWRSGLYLREYLRDPADVVAETFSSLARAQTRWPFSLVLKPHPSDPYSDEAYRDLAGREGLSMDAVPPRENNMPHALAPLLRATDVLLCYQSTIALEGLIHGARVISLSLHVPELVYVEAASIAKAATAAQLESALEEAIELPPSAEEEEQRDRDLREYNAHNDGRATERVLRVIGLLLDHGRRHEAGHMEPRAAAQ